MVREKIIYNPEKIYIPETIENIRKGNQGSVDVLQDKSIVIRNNRILSIINTGTLRNNPDNYTYIDTSGKIVTPGFVDSHTHMVYAGDRSEEFEMRSRGIKYIDLMKSGNGILKTVRDTRKASEGEITFQSLKRAIKHMINGVTTMEIKSGYGLDLINEGKMLDVMDRLQGTIPARIVKTLLPLHAVPPDSDRESYVRKSCNEILPALQERVDFVDSFCDEGAFTLSDTEKVFSKAVEAGKKLRLHADEIGDIGALGLLREFSISSVDHLLHSSASGMDNAMYRDVVATILPGTAFSLGENYARAGEWIERHVPVAVASDISPLSPVVDIKFHGNLAIRHCGMTTDELFNGLTTVPAHSLGLVRNKGNIGPGYDADLLIIETGALRNVFYDWANIQLTTVIGGNVLDVKKIMRKSIKP